ncbi:unnamed protein product [Citrullus colocynthis]|uniref:Uncharacterized protein n=1 Tax=Citrullus colocynthis TaxID=252529 RepID=A0ABP0YV93_9ROSI
MLARLFSTGLFIYLLLYMRYSIYPVCKSISAARNSNKPFILPTAIGNAFEDLLVAFRVINSSSPVKHPRSCLTLHMALIALQFLAFCFNFLPHHIWRRAFPVEALSPNRSAKECNRIRIRKIDKQNHKHKKLVDG